MTRAQLDANHLDAQSAFVCEFLEEYNDPEWNPKKSDIPALLWPYFEQTDTRLREAGGTVDPANGMLLVFCLSTYRARCRLHAGSGHAGVASQNDCGSDPPHSIWYSLARSPKIELLRCCITAIYSA